MAKVRWWCVRVSTDDKEIGRVLATSIDVAHSLARLRYGHDVAVYNRDVVCPPHVTPDPLPEVEHFGAGFYATNPVNRVVDWYDDATARGLSTE